VYYVTLHENRKISLRRVILNKNFWQSWGKWHIRVVTVTQNVISDYSTLGKTIVILTHRPSRIFRFGRFFVLLNTNSAVVCPSDSFRQLSLCTFTVVFIILKWNAVLSMDKGKWCWISCSCRLFSSWFAAALYPDSVTSIVLKTAGLRQVSDFSLVTTCRRPGQSLPASVSS